MSCEDQSEDCQVIMSKDDFENKMSNEFMRGNRQVYVALLQMVLAHLDPSDRDKHSWLIERANVVNLLRQICEEHGDNRWEDDLNLQDVLEKYLFIPLGLM